MIVTIPQHSGAHFLSEAPQLQPSQPPDSLVVVEQVVVSGWNTSDKPLDIIENDWDAYHVDLNLR